MKKTSAILLVRLSLMLFMAVIAGCRTPQTCDTHNTITQVATIDALLAGAYDGVMSLNDLLDHGDFGIGTFDRLDGEMIVLDGRVYQVRADGTVHEPPLNATTPFAAVARFRPDIRLDISHSVSFDELQALIDAEIRNPNLMYAILVRGHFDLVKTRSVPAQGKPYPPLHIVTADQPVFRAGNISGTLVGFRLPAYVSGVNVPGYHLHFLSDDREFGGHLLECNLQAGFLEMDVCHRFFMILPEDDESFAQLDLSVDRSETLKAVER